MGNYPIIPFAPPDATPVALDDRKLWKDRQKHLGELWDELNQGLRPLLDANPQWIRPTARLDDADGFTRMSDLVSNSRLILDRFLQKPSLGVLDQWHNRYSPRVDDVFDEVKSTLKTHAAKADGWQAKEDIMQTRRVADDLQWALHEMFAAGEKLRHPSAPDTHAAQLGGKFERRTR
jgi:hypothetical protein